jgi:hypothetical protein
MTICELISEKTNTLNQRVATYSCLLCNNQIEQVESSKSILEPVVNIECKKCSFLFIKEEEELI